MTKANDVPRLHPTEQGGPHSLETDCLVLRPVHKTQVTELHAFFGDPEVRRYLTDGTWMPRTWVEGIIRDSDVSFAERGLGLWSVCEHGVDTIIGLTGFRDFYDPPVLELLYALLPSHWHRGLATEMARAAVDFAFHHAGHADIHASIDEPNQASLRVLERLGMHPCGRTAAEMGPFSWDQLHFVLRREE